MDAVPQGSLLNLIRSTPSEAVDPTDPSVNGDRDGNAPSGTQVIEEYELDAETQSAPTPRQPEETAPVQSFSGDSGEEVEDEEYEEDAPYDPRLNPEYVSHLEQVAAENGSVARRAVLAQLAREEQEFRRSLEFMSDEERRVAVLERQNRQLAAQAQTLAQQQEHQRAQAEAQANAQAKAMVAATIANRTGLNYGNDTVREALMAAPNLAAMKNIATALVGTAVEIGRQYQSQAAAAPTARQQELVNLRNRGAFAGGGDVAGSAPPVQAKKGSGDIMGLIQGRKYAVVPVAGHTNNG